MQEWIFTNKLDEDNSEIKNTACNEMKIKLKIGITDYLFIWIFHAFPTFSDFGLLEVIQSLQSLCCDGFLFVCLFLWSSYHLFLNNLWLNNFL